MHAAGSRFLHDENHRKEWGTAGSTGRSVHPLRQRSLLCIRHRQRQRHTGLHLQGFEKLEIALGRRQGSPCTRQTGQLRQQMVLGPGGVSHRRNLLHVLFCRGTHLCRHIRIAARAIQTKGETPDDRRPQHRQFALHRPKWTGLPVLGQNRHMQRNLGLRTRKGSANASA